MTSPQTLVAARPAVRSMDSVLVNRWARLVMPSLSDLFFLAILVWVFMSSGSAGWQGLLVDGDVGWHIRTGEYILDHHSVPHQDLYSFSKPNAPWYAWEWLTDVTDGALHRAAGLKGIVLTAGVIIALFATTLIRRMIWRGVHVFVALVVSLMGVGSASIHFLARPHIYTLLLMSVSVWMIEADRKRPRARIWLLVPLTVLWTSLHGGFLAMIAVLGLTAVGLGIEALLRHGEWSEAIRYGKLTAACAAASFVNPYGWHLHQHVIEYLRSDWIRNVIQEFQSPSFRNENMLQFEALLFIGLMVAGLAFRAGRITEGLWIIFFAYQSLSSVRHVPIFVTVTVPIIATQVSEWWREWTAGAKKSSLAGIVNQMASDWPKGFRRTSVWPFVAVMVLIVMGRPIPWPKDFAPEIFPVDIIHRHTTELASARLLTTDQWADYFIYLNPSQKVFVDGRSDFYGPEVGNEYIHIINGQWDWAQLMQKYQFGVALLPVESAITQLLKVAPDWKVVEDDGKRVLLIRRATSVLAAENTKPEPRS